MKTVGKVGAAVAALVFLSTPMGAARAADVPISDAERLLFVSNHLARVGLHRQLDYGVKKQGSLEAGFDGSAKLDILSRDGQGKAVDIHFLPGQPDASNPSLPHVEGNPILLLFLERQTREMARLTGGHADYFKRRIRAALAEHAKISDVQVDVGGRSRPAKRIEISPYLEDPNRDRFEKFARESYLFELADGVPGTIYRLEARLPAPDGDAKAAPMLDETLTFKAEQPLKK